MKELITKIEGYCHHTNDLTKKMDSYVPRQSSNFKTYVMNEKFRGSYAIRFPGATVGHIKVDDDNLITEIDLYSDTEHFYNEGVKSCFDKYIGMKLVIL